MAGICFTAKYNGITRELKSKVSISSCFSGKDNASKEKEALWDTGANRSVITEKLAGELQLVPISQINVNTPSGSHKANIYQVDVLLPNNVAISKLEVCSGHSNQWDMLIGMDIITMGDFAVSNFGGRTSYTFRMPSMMDFDFVHKSLLEPMKKGIKIQPNEPCPCGSGQKFKKCNCKDYH
ncbi:MAG: retroviral-like aspartic protease family protein [Clostridiales bacterium]|jgi:predicted aspartyl protease|nr:retroviral-like aspartic protease family protein [Clostridiales bacterium]